ncbi:Squalene synthase 1-like protein [Theobroma cacao]|uniref:Squalene synthase 1-like protein n=1 Tax=Theobroma cacao TaxID=3641 RepID=S1RU34_THECC|nr:Squalene synthase 1-like protein [Theobroma cacao]
MGSLGTLVKHPDDLYPLLKLKMAVRQAGKQIPPEPHWAFCFSMLHKVSRSFALVIQQLHPKLRNAFLNQRMGSLGAVLKLPNDLYPLLKLKNMAARYAGKHILILEPRRSFCFSSSMIHKFSRCAILASELAKHPNEFYPLLKLKMAARHAGKHVQSAEHNWVFCFSILFNISSFAILAPLLDYELKKFVSIFSPKNRKKMKRNV